MRTDILQSSIAVPGARLRYFVQGSGPLVLLLAGGHGDASKNEALATHLADSSTVLTYDRRGLSGSTTDDPARTLAVHAEDASRLLAAVGGGPARVYGTSIGGAIALTLTAMHPEQVGTVVVHEPALAALLPEPARAAATHDLLGVEEAYGRDGVDAALRSFADFAGIDPTDSEPDVELAPPGRQQLANLAYFVVHDLPLVRDHVPDLSGLRGTSARIVPAVGASSGHLWPAACARLLAERLGLAYETFPGGHNGYVFRPRETAARLRQVLES
ncbi:alpha/beta hydrolase [Nocardioides sp. CER19]|uniref:alpha/beta fold hydrolase n=1 Tax=Nocardioides sp. CER19 TaxID=3038538 RepID=UPI0024485A24|nr:alpha/beta hydrolase [Nocardioides sp. CER19]MDH2413303.1 alpha/beta hydrolase [Nocardioides sp. CER19]